MKHRIALLAILCLLVACTAAPAESDQTPMEVETVSPTTMPTDTPEPTSTPTAAPTETPEPTEVPTNTSTPEPTKVGGGQAKVAFTSFDTGNGDIYVLDLSTDTLMAIAAHEEQEVNPVWSPDGTTLLYLSSEKTPNRNVVMINADGSNKQYLTDNQTGDPDVRYEYIWDPTGSFFYIAKGSYNANGSYELSEFTRFDFDGSNPQAVEVFPVAWSFRNDWLVGYGNVEGDNEIFLANPDGTGGMNLSNDPASDDLPQFSPDGSMVLFRSDRTGTTDFFVVNLDGSDLRNLTPGEANVTDAAFSPDGKTLYYATYIRDGNNNNREIFSVSVDGGEPVNLTNSKVNEYFFELTPDGSTLIMTAANYNNWEIWAMNVDGSDRRVLIGETSNTVWGYSSDQRWMMLTSTVDDISTAYLLSLDDLTLKPLSEAYGEMGMHYLTWQP